MSYHGVPIPDSVFRDEVKRHQRLYPGKTVWDIGCGQDLPLSPAELAEVITGASGRLARVLGQGRQVIHGR